MRLTTYASAADFLACTQAALEVDEVANNLMLGVAQHLLADAPLIGTAPYLATVGDESGLKLVALTEPPYPLTLFCPRPMPGDLNAACELVIRDLLARGLLVRAVSGRTPLPDHFVGSWKAVTGAGWQLSMHERIYELRRVIPARPVPGRFRPATQVDADTVAGWAAAFMIEVMPMADPAAAADNARQRILRGEVYVWEDGGQPVSMAVTSRPLITSISVSLVYTPPTRRGRGYASACVAALSQHLLDQGWQSCSLFADLANPTSNGIYQKIGYQPVCDFDEYALLEPF